jgi:hypothetical protein
MRLAMRAAVILLCNAAVFAQDAPRAQVFAGYSYGNYELLSSTSGILVGPNAAVTGSSGSSLRLGLSGWNASVAVNLNRWLLFATDTSGYYSGSSASSTSTQTFLPCAGCNIQTNTTVNTFERPRIHNFLFGPQFSYPNRKIRPFAQFLIGGEHVDLARMVTASSSGGIVPIPPAVLSGRVAETGFAMAFGGGLDYSIKPCLAWRLQADYLTSAAGIAQNHVRISSGLVWRLGH